jgi:hypothetical protein
VNCRLRDPNRTEAGLKSCSAAVFRLGGHEALAFNPRHRSAHEHLGEAYLVKGDLVKAQEQLAALQDICLIPCVEYAPAGAAWQPISW